ncbi:hypothetical protein DPMN_112529 [Dreissena polymorpha]|uniref:Uncharacterized protein n=1 Tax=Dreissena polymorpha TaxID=45954 RepID=A0A9D4KG99_DREPO|nr:hypothetical protein DPMN_112529 [Dreissena polymorpha]
MNAARVPETGALRKCHRHSPGLRRGITGDDRGETGALPHGECWRCYGIPGLCRDAVGFRRGTTGDNGGYTGTLPAFTGALPTTTGALPGLDRDKPDSSGLVSALKKCLRIIPVLAGQPALANQDRPGLYRQK